ncbi:TraR/DksA family transcriptional regulator [Rhizohabitans arisaemae]|uniref:TraR/DksA family transcriptional regulator n=1 Tax=Rhizohabitans arisaemae TaxID=2720610 RepID=UPI0024B0CF48|nr:TraR/DksA C4-type zinc finger protein [Rhizohabitans arisaemae]
MDPAAARTRLEAMLVDLDRSIGVLSGEQIGLPDRSAADAGSDLTENARTAAMLQVAERQRKAVREALRRIGEGTYGACVDCRKEVPEGRLEARPEASRCVVCQSRLERARR